MAARDGRQEGRLAGIGQADEPGIGDQLQAQPDPALLALEARIGAARGAVGRGREIGVAEAAVAALGEQDALADLGHVGDQRLAVLVEDLRAGRHLEHHVRALGAGAVPAHAVPALLGLEMLLVAVVDQRVQALDALGPDVAAAAAVAAVRPAELDEFFAPERDAAGAAVAGADVDLGLVEEFHEPHSSIRGDGPREQRGATRKRHRSSASANRAAWSGAPDIGSRGFAVRAGPRSRIRLATRPLGPRP